MKYDLEGKIFAPVQNSENGETDESTRFRYHQDGDIVWADYEGGSIRRGHLIARIMDDGRLDMRYQHLNTEGQFKLGKCMSIPVLLPDGRLKFQEHWQWLTGDLSKGYSEIEQIADGET